MTEAGSENMSRRLQALIRRGWQLAPRGRLVRGSLAVMVGQAARLVMLAIWVVFAARVLGPEGYGIFAGVAGLATVMASFSGLGVGLLMYQRVAIHPGEFSIRWRQTRFITFTSGLVIAAIFAVVGHLLFGAVAVRILFMIALSEIILFPLVSAAAFAFAAHERMDWAAALPAVSAALRLGAIASLATLSTTARLETYLWFHLFASALGSGISLACVRIILGPAAAKLSITRSELSEGLAFAVVWFTGNAMTSLDKSLVLRVGGSAMSGLYAVAYRIGSVLAMPIDALVMTAMPRLFRAGSGSAEHPKLVASLFFATGAYGAVAGAILWFGAAHIPALLGREFGSAVPALQWMSLFIPLYGTRQLGSQLLITQGKKFSRALIDVCTLVAMVSLAHYLIPRWGLAGAVAMILGSEGLLVVVIWVTLAKTLFVRSG